METSTLPQERERPASEIKVAWDIYQSAKSKHGLDFGKICYEWREKFKSRAGRTSKGEGIIPILEQFKIPVSTAYHWIIKYEKSIGLRPWTPDQEKRKNRSEPLNTFDEVKSLAIEIVNAGYLALRADRDRGHLWAAKEWAVGVIAEQK